ncbi:MAG: ECF transporter S component [Lachnospiraceae bacterium]|nr:ECF transporter S component [Lachnospiraceae bacterium]
MQEKSVEKNKNIIRDTIKLLIVFFVMPLTIFFTWKYAGNKYYLTSLILIIFAVVPFFLRFEKRKPEAREMVTLAVICAIAVISRVAFSMVPHFKPMAAIIMISGIAFGGEAGFLVGAISAFVSNFVFMQGPWTPWQMFAYGIGGLLAGVLAKVKIMKVDKPLRTAILGGVLIIAVVGPLLDTCSLFTMGIEINKSSIATTYLAGLPLNAVHAVATLATLLLIGKPMTEKLYRIQRKYGIMREE